MKEMNLWRSIYDFLARLIKWSVVVAVISTGIVLLLSVTDIIGSKFFNLGVPGANAFVEELNIVIVFMAIAYVQIERRHVTITMLNRLMSATVKHALTLFGDVLGILTCGFFSWRAFILMQKMISIHDIKNAAAIEFPLWPFALVSFYGFAALTMAFIMCFVRATITGTDE